jgi:hypothetical protein
MKARITLTYEYELDPDNYDPGLTPQQMLKVDEENDAHAMLVEEMTPHYELIDNSKPQPSPHRDTTEGSIPKS